MEIEENNKLIAEFMGLPTEVFKSGIVNYYFREFNSGSWYEEHELSYNVSWDWLMPVVEKIESLGYGVTIGMGVYVVIQDDVTDTGLEITKMTDNNKLFCTYEAVVEFIKWYNENK